MQPSDLPPNAYPVMIGQVCPCGTGQPFDKCHGAETRPTQEQIERWIGKQTPDLGRPPTQLRLNLACGQNSKIGFEGVDLTPGPTVTHVVDLLTFPWPWADSSVLEIYCNHFIEHIPAVCVDASGNYVRHNEPGARDAFFAFFDEAYRVLVDGGLMTVDAPASCSDRAFRDPTHRRFITSETFHYLNRTYRQTQKLDHYNVVCHFEGGYAPSLEPEVALRHPEAGQRMLKHGRNWVIDWHAYLRANKRT